MKRTSKNLECAISNIALGNPEKGFEFVYRVWGKCTIAEADALLWHCTAFPCIDVEELETQLIDVKLKSGGDYNLAMKQADEAMSRCLVASKRLTDVLGPAFEEKKLAIQDSSTFHNPVKNMKLTLRPIYGKGQGKKQD